MREFINTLSSLHYPPTSLSTLHLGRSSNNPIALLSWRRPTRRLVGLLTTHLRVVRVLRLLELDPALLSAIVIRVATILLVTILLVTILLLRWAVRRRRCRSATVVVSALLSLVVVVLVMLLAASVLSGKPASAVAWCEATTAATTGVDASTRLLVWFARLDTRQNRTHEQANASTRKKPTMTTSATQRPQRFQLELFL